MRFLRTGNGKINLIFLHGWGAGNSSFVWLSNHLNKYNLHFASLDGFDNEPPPTDCTIGGYANRVGEYIKQNNLTNVVLVGHSFGGRVAIEYASCHKILGLVLVDSAGVKPKFSLKKWLKIKKYKFLKKFFKNKFVQKKYGSKDYQSCSENMKKVLVYAVNYDQTKLLEKIDCQTLVYWGKQDKDTPLYMAKTIHKKIKNSSLFLADGGHFSFLNNPMQFKDCLEYFVDNIGE